MTALDDLHDRCLHWFGEHYDLDAIDITLVAAAVERLNGDPLWVLIVGGSGATKTETVMPLVGCGGLVASTISSDAALLSGTPQKERKKNATGGLLRALGNRGLLIIKDVTSILSLHPNMRSQIMAALREVYDGYWYRDVGSDGGRRLEWAGRIAIVGAVTTAWDQHHAAVAQMGDRFVLLRTNSAQHRHPDGAKAVRGTGGENDMREELAKLAHEAVAAVDPEVLPELTDSEVDRIVTAADLVTRARTGVIYDYKGDVVDAHALEMPTRFSKQLAQVLRGAVAIGITREQAMRLAIRCARDSMPPLRLEILDDLAAHPSATTTEVRKRIGRPRNTVDRQLQALQMLGAVTVDEVEYPERSRWYYSLSAEVDPACLLVPVITVATVSVCKENPPTVKAGTKFTPPHGTGRCPECGWHIPTQGHTRNCSANEWSTRDE